MNQCKPIATRNLSQLTDANSAAQVQPPSSMNKEIAFGIQSSTQMYIKHGIGYQRLNEIAKDGGETKTLVTRWQRMMEAFLGTQVHVIAGLGYSPNEQGLHLYNQHVAMFMQSADPETQEKLRINTRDVWRFVLSTAFGIPRDQIESNEVSIVDARNVMHKVALKMQDPAILEIISEKCGKMESTGNPQMDMAMKHQVVQDTLVNDVYLGGSPSLVEECGFEAGEKGYVFMQCIMSEHQNDPLIGQYVGSAMMQLMKAAGIDMSDIQRAAEEIQK